MLVISKLEKNIKQSNNKPGSKRLKGIGSDRPSPLHYPYLWVSREEKNLQVFHIQRRDKSPNTRRFNSRITGRYRQLYIQYSFSQTFYRVYSEYSIFCRYMQHKVSTSHVILTRRRKECNLIKQGVQSSIASTVADRSPGRDLISQSQQPADTSTI